VLAALSIVTALLPEAKRGATTAIAASTTTSRSGARQAPRRLPNPARVEGARIASGIVPPRPAEGELLPADHRDEDHALRHRLPERADAEEREHVGHQR
jgi:hypothetical protein